LFGTWFGPQPDLTSGGVGLEKKDRKGEDHVIFPLKVERSKSLSLNMPMASFLITV
jgi:hypothetical protein